MPRSIQTYEDAKIILQSYLFHKEKTYYRTLTRIQKLCDYLGNPEQKLSVIQVGGTAGKGSTSIMTASILTHAGKTVGLYTKPHIYKITERFSINGNGMSDAEFILYVKKILPYARKVEKEISKPTFFELLVAIALTYFYDHHVDVAILEVGLGGLYDASSVVHPKISILTNVGLDHTEWLGPTVEDIVKEKMHIFKAGCTAICGVLPASCKKLVRTHCSENNIPLLRMKKEFTMTYISMFSQNAKHKAGVTTFNYQEKSIRIPSIECSLAGFHQAENAALAIAGARAYMNITDENIRDGVATIKHFGRLDQKIIGNTTIYFDGAHNPMKIQALVKTMKYLLEKNKIPIIFDVKANKDFHTMIHYLKPIASAFILPQYQKMTPWGSPVMATPKNIQRAIHTIGKEIPIHLIQMYDMKVYIQKMKFSDMLVTGSLYIVGEMRKILC